MKIGVIGAGEVGQALTLKMAAAGHAVKIANSRGPETLVDIARKTGATPVTVEESVENVDVIIIAVPWKAFRQIPADLFQAVPDCTTIIDTSNYNRQRDGTFASFTLGMSESEWVASQVGRPVIKVFNNIGAYSVTMLGRPRGSSERLGIPVAGDDADAKAIAFSIVQATGFDPVDGGDLSNSWRQQTGSPAFCTDLSADGVLQALARADRSQLSEIANKALQNLGNRTSASPDFVEYWRSVHLASME